MDGPATATPYSLDAQNLACMRGERIVFRDVAFCLKPGEGLIVRGPNGAGKSSLLRLLAGLLRPAEGTIRYDGQDIAGDVNAYLRHAAYLGHQDGLKSTETPREAIRFRARLHNSPSPPLGVRGTDQQAGTGSAFTLTRPATPAGLSLNKGEAELLHALNLTVLADTPIRALSAGQKRRAALAALAATGAPLWLVDEPTASLDSESAGLFRDMLERHLAMGGMAVVTTHDREAWPPCRELALGETA
jgi:heme exporter protein A